VVIPALRKSYTALPKSHIENIAIDSQDGGKNIYIVGNAAAKIYDRLGYDCTRVTSFSRDFVMEHIAENVGKKFATDVKTLTVKTAPLSKIVTQYGFCDADALPVDAEGHDFEVLKSANLATWLPQVINFEFCNLSTIHLAISYLRPKLTALRLEVQIKLLVGSESSPEAERGCGRVPHSPSLGTTSPCGLREITEPWSSP
jgi:hypothetical protein